VPPARHPQVAASVPAQLSLPGELTAAYAAAVVALTQVIAAFNEQIAVMGHQVSLPCRRRLAARIYLSQPGLGALLAATRPGPPRSPSWTPPWKRLPPTLPSRFPGIWQAWAPVSLPRCWSPSATTPGLSRTDLFHDHLT